jgi:hypothetical protein
MAKFRIGQWVQIISWYRSPARVADLGEAHGGFLEETHVNHKRKTCWGGTVRRIRSIRGPVVYTIVGRVRFSVTQLPNPDEVGGPNTTRTN